MASATASALNEENPIETPDQQQQQQSDPLTTNATLSDGVNSSPKDESKSVGDSPAVGSEAVKNDDGDAPVTDIQKKIRRAERFGTSVQLSEEEKRNSRAERFGTGSGSGSAINGSDALKKSEEQKRKARAERFGSPQSAPADEEAKKKARHARFAGVPKTDPLEEDKKKARAIRFSQPQSGAISQVNGIVNDIDMKGAIKGKVGGET